ncbi:MAG: TetR/AcrR family transcriptional regulator [Clostridium sp.]|jgi:AcrR family transcriptional regulator|nr:TetR/AcrR family transcriptional regulator [Clostridium sp.]
MNAKFFDLNKEKQDRMMNAALKVFALHGYRHASTDDIVREAGISKGLLFHYFGTKLGAYAFVYDYSVRFLALELRACVKPQEKDLFELVKQVEQAKMQAMKGYPYMQQFLDRSMTEDVGEALLAVEEKRNLLGEVYGKIYAQTDRTLLPPGADVGKLQKILCFTVKGLLAECFQEASFQPEMFYREAAEYLDLIKRMITVWQEDPAKP